MASTQYMDIGCYAIANKICPLLKKFLHHILEGIDVGICKIYALLKNLNGLTTYAAGIFPLFLLIYNWYSSIY
jgi:hypothetical protein